MSSVRSRVARIGSDAGALIDDLTPGQRWTAALMLMMATAVIAFGLPSATIVQQSTAAPASPRVTRPTAPPATSDEPSAPARPGEPEDGPGTDGAEAPAAAVAPPPPLPAGPVARPDIVALVRSDPTRLGRDDATIAAAFLDQARFDATVIELTEDEALCDQVVAAGQVVLAGHGLPPQLRDCLVQRSVLVIAHDALGSVAPFPAPGQVVSTRRGHRASLVDLGRWAVQSDALGSTPGLVVSAEYRPEVDAAVADLETMGIVFERIHYVPDGVGRDQEILAGVQDFSAAGVDTVVFAADVDDQSRWVEVQQVLGPTTAYLVSDVGDAIVEEGYPSFFEGARAHTSLRTPWWERREGGETPEQEECRTHWENSAPPGAPTSPSELRLAYVWCQHAWLMVEPALDLVAGGVEFDDALRSLVVDSPVTSQLGALGPFGWGPRRDVALAWSGDCGCWEPDGGFRRR